MRIRTPTQNEIIELQRSESAFYWSNCAEGLLRKHGIIQVFDSQVEQLGAATSIATRGTHFAQKEIDRLTLIEGKVADDTLAKLSLSATACETNSLHLFDADRMPLGTLKYPVISTRAIPPLNQAVPSDRPQPRRWRSDDARWNNTVIRCQQLSADAPWRCIAFAGSERSRPEWPIAISDGRRFVLGAPLLDLLCCAHAFPPLTDSFYSEERSDSIFEVEKWLIEQFLQHCAAGEQTVVRVSNWPTPFRSALTIRHDYDRPVSNDDWNSLLNFHADQGIKASIGWPVKTLDTSQMTSAAEQGHEINIHSEAPDDRAFLAEADHITSSLGSVPMGMTAHGGHGSAGFLGDTQYGWLDDAGMLWSEILRRATGLPFAVNRLINDAPGSSDLISFPWHRSLDIGTAPDAHRLVKLETNVPTFLADGQHVTLMNHPDIHIDELKQLITGLDLSSTWCATFHQVAEWIKASKLNSNATIDARDKLRIRFAMPLPAEATIRIVFANGVTKRLQCEKGCDDARISLV
jgi:hypothetical protein